jgi:hypothetical protein
MNIKEKKIISVLREEYNNRLDYFLKERLSIKDKRGVNLIKNAIGLKVRDKAGFEYTVAGIVKKDNEEFIKLYLPEIGREIDDQKSTAPLYEFDGDYFESDLPQNGFISRNSAGMRDVSYDASLDSAENDYLDSSISNDEKKDQVTRYILVPAGEFEERFEV